MRRVMAHEFQRLFVTRGDDGQIGVLLDDAAGIHQLAVEPAGQRGLCQTRADGLGDLVDADRLTVRYASALNLMQELKSFGLSNALAARRRGLVPPRLLAAASAACDAQFADPDGRVRATFQMLYLTGWAPHESQPRPLRPGSAKASLAEALNVVERKLPKGE